MSDQGTSKVGEGQFCIVSNSNAAEVPGPAAVSIQAVNKDGVKFNISHHEGEGLSRIHADKCLQIDVGDDCSNESVTFNVSSLKGDIALTSCNADVRIKGRNVTIDAIESLTIGGRTIKIGKDAAESDKTESISITGNSVDTDADGGNLAELLGTGPLMSIFAGTALAGAAAIASGIGKAAGGAAGQMAGSEPIGGGGGAGGNNLSPETIEVSGISTFGSVQISSGIITSTSTSGIVTYFGDGSNLSGIGSLTAAVEQIDYTCTNPITTLGNTIKISEDSNAYGTRYVESGTPSSSDGCDGDIWYSTTGTFLGAVPVGAVFHFASSTAPNGYLKANGDTVPNGSGTVQGVTADFSALYAILGSTYGSAGQLPDLRAEFIRGWDDSRGVDSGRTFGSSQDHQLQEHSHGRGAIYPGSGPEQNQSGSREDNTSFNQQTTTSGTTGNFGAETRPRNVALLACIKY